MVPPPPPPFTFTIPRSITAFNISKACYLASHPEYVEIVSGALVFNNHDKVLLLQRASHDFMPNRWEVPGGSVDPEDVTIIHGVARELWEEAGLKVKDIKQHVGDGNSFPITSSGDLWAIKFTFLVEVESAEEGKSSDLMVRIDPDEHQKFVWASEEECRAKKVGSGKGGLVLDFTSQAQFETILEGFRIRKAENGDSA